MLAWIAMNVPPANRDKRVPAPLQRDTGIAAHGQDVAAPVTRKHPALRKVHIMRKFRANKPAPGPGLRGGKTRTYQRSRRAPSHAPAAAVIAIAVPYQVT